MTPVSCLGDDAGGWSLVRERELTTRFIPLPPRTGSTSPASALSGQGDVEGKEGYFRRNSRVPVPATRDLAELKARLLADGRHDENRILSGRTQSVDGLLLGEKGHLPPLPVDGLELSEVSLPRGVQAGCANARTLKSTPCH
jgi:hypothetical protein